MLIKRCVCGSIVSGQIKTQNSAKKVMNTYTISVFNVEEDSFSHDFQISEEFAAFLTHKFLLTSLEDINRSNVVLGKSASGNEEFILSISKAR